MNNYYNHQSPLASGTKARAEDINSRCNDIQAGFDKLPAPYPGAPDTKGFGEPFAVVPATGEDHAVKASQVRDGELTYAEDTGTANALEVSLPIPAVAYKTGMTITVKIAKTNSGAATINVDGLGLKNIKRISGEDVRGSDLAAGRISTMRYDGTNFVLLDGMYAIHAHPDLYPSIEEFESHGHDYVPVNGTAADSDKLGGYGASEYPRQNTEASYSKLSGSCLATSTDMTNATAGKVVTVDKMLERTATTARYGVTKLSSSTSSTSTVLAANALAVKNTYDRTKSFYGGTRGSTGDWVLLNVDTTRDLTIQLAYDEGDAGTICRFRFKSGTNNRGNTAVGSFYQLEGDNESQYSTTCSATITPASSTVIINITALMGTLYVFQK